MTLYIGTKDQCLRYSHITAFDLVGYGGWIKRDGVRFYFFLPHPITKVVVV